MQWLRLYTRIMTDPDVEELSFEDQRHYVWLLCMKSEGLLDKDFGGDYEKRDRAIARRLGLQGEAFTFAKERLVMSRLVDLNFQPRNWDKLQFKSDHDSAERQRRSRASRGITSQSRDSHTPEQNRTDTDTETDTHKSAALPLGGFSRFWDAYPKKVKRKDAERVWRSKKLDEKAAQLIADAQRRLAEDDQWRRGFIPDPPVYLRGERWNDEIQSARAVAPKFAPFVPPPDDEAASA